MSKTHACICGVLVFFNESISTRSCFFVYVFVCWISSEMCLKTNNKKKDWHQKWKRNNVHTHTHTHSNTHINRLKIQIVKFSMYSERMPVVDGVSMTSHNAFQYFNELWSSLRIHKPTTHTLTSECGTFWHLTLFASHQFSKQNLFNLSVYFCLNQINRMKNSFSSLNSRIFGIKFL